MLGGIGISELEIKDEILTTFNRLTDDIVRAAKEEMISRDGGCMGCARIVPKYTPFERAAIRQATEEAKAVFARKFSLPTRKEEREEWENELILDLNGELDDQKYYGDPEDPEWRIHNNTLEKIEKQIPDFIKGLEI